MGPFEVWVAGIVVGVPGILGFFALITRFHLKKQELEMRGSDPELGPKVDALRDDLDDARGQLAGMQEHTQAQLAEMQERLDFTERLLTKGRHPD